MEIKAAPGILASKTKKPIFLFGSPISVSSLEKLFLTFLLKMRANLVILKSLEKGVYSKILGVQ